MLTPTNLIISETIQSPMKRKKIVLKEKEEGTDENAKLMKSFSNAGGMCPLSWVRFFICGTNMCLYER
jgi:hypothetical protein